jgi:hypothetical protein
VQATCKHLLHTLQSNLDAPNVQTLLKEIVGPVYDLHMKRREKLETQGKNVLSQVQTSLAAKAREIREMEKELETEKASEVPNATANSAT